MASDWTSVRIDDIEAIAGDSFRRARAALGVTSFGMQVVDLRPDEHRYPEHDHVQDGQEEVYVVLRGGGEIEIDATRHPLEPDVLYRVGPSVRRKLLAGPDGVRLVVLGGIPGSFEHKDYTELDTPDPFAR